MTEASAAPSFWTRLKQRKLIQWVIGYAAFAWVAAQLVGSVSGSFGWPPLVMKVVWIFAGLGLVAAIVVAWYHGERGHQRVTLPEIAMLLALFIIAAAAVSLVKAGAETAPAALQKAAVDTTSSTFMASVAVLPFETYTANPRDAYLGDAIAEEITTQLGRVPALKVISRTSVGRYKGARASMRGIADTLGVRHVVEGSITLQPGSNLMKVTVQLIDATRDEHVNANTWVTEPSQLFESQEKIARWVLDLVLARVHNVQLVTGRMAGREESAAYHEFTLGRTEAHKRTQAGLSAALDHLNRAIEIDPKYAPAHAMLASIYGLWGTYSYAGEPDTYSGYATGLAHAAHAIQLDSTLAEAYAARGYMLSKSWAPADLIQRDFDRALMLGPGSADVHSLYAHFLARERRFSEAVQAAQRSIALDPLAPGRNVGLAYASLAARQYSLAVLAAKTARQQDPNLKMPRALQAIALILSGRTADCELIPLEATPGVQAICLAALGRQHEAAQIIDSLRSAPLNSVNAQQLALYFGWLGDVNQAINWTRESYRRSPNGLDFRYVMGGLFDRVLTDTRFETFLNQTHASIWASVQRESNNLRTTHPLTN